MNNTYNSNLIDNAKTLRKNMTKEERHLWYDFLKQLSVTVNRQKVIGKFIVDFYIASAKIVIELDGSQHYKDDGIAKDLERDEFLANQGILVLRYTNLQIQRQFQDVCRDIRNHIRERTGKGNQNMDGK